MPHESDTVLHADDHLLPDPLSDQVVAEEDHGGPRHEPDCEEQRELVVEATLEKNYVCCMI